MMKQRYMKRIFSFLLSLALSSVLLVPAGASFVPEEPVLQKAVVQFLPDTPVEEILQTLQQLPDTRVLYRYDALFSGAAVETSAASLARIRRLPGVSGADFSAEHTRTQTISDPLTVSNSLDAMYDPDPDYTGDGIVIAVLDSGLRYSHSAFAENDLMQSPAISREEVDAFAEEGGTPGRYLSERIPFAYDYSTGDPDVSTADPHGTHVSALAVGYATDDAGQVVFRGVAPAAQLLSMKVFPDRAEIGASDADILLALQDAWLLGADVICLSLGVDSGFSTGTTISQLYSEAFQKMRQSGVIICCAVGNSATTVSAKPDGITLPTAAYTDYGTVATPASFQGATAVTAANARVVQSSGYIQSGDHQLSFTPASSETGLTLPTLEKLEGRTLTLVPVGGVGRTEDFAAVNVRGKVAAVTRGEITFTEKVQNAARSGAAACLVINNVAEEITPIVESDSIPCVLLSQTEGAYLLEQIAAGNRTVRVSSGSYLQTLSSQPEMLLQSSWGPTYDLRISPTLTAPGGDILSACADEDDLYLQMSGTSMATPNAAGAYALVLEKLYASGMTKSAETAAMAENLLTGTAHLMQTDGGVPLSPRQQGAGLIDLRAALNAELLISNPLLELGESTNGQFTLSFRVKNLSDKEMALTLTPTVLADDWAEDGATVYSLLSPRDLTDLVTLTGPDTLSLPAGGERTVTWQLTVPADLRQELGQVFSNGFFVEGYITLASADDHEAHATFLGYCGDWEQGDIVSQTDFRDVLTAAATETALAETDLGLTMVYLSGDSSLLLGQNPYRAAVPSDSRFAISTFESDAHFSDGTLFTAKLATLRNAQRLIMVISDQNSGRIYFVTDMEQVHHTALSPLTGEMESSAQFQWSGTTMDGVPLPDGTAVTVEFYGWTESDTAMTDTYTRSGCSPNQPESYRWLTSGSYDRALEWSFPLTIDRTAPTASAALSADGDTLSITASDNRFLAYAAVLDGSGTVLAEEACADEIAGQSHTLKVDLSEYDTAPKTLYVTASDYAVNTIGYAIDLTDDTVTPCAMCLLTDVNLDAWYHEAVDLVWQLGLMANEDELAFQPDRGATRADVISALYQAAGAPDADIPLPFSDVNSGAWYYDALQWAYGEGIVSGYSDTTFAAFAFVSRQQLAAMLYRCGDSGSADTSVLAAFPDAGDVDGWAQEAMAWAVAEGLFSGRENGTLSPDATATRAELAQILVRFLDL